MNRLNTTNQITTRFAPSPTGLLHIGHAYSALFAYTEAIRQNERFILRIEDIDVTRCKPEFETGIYEDLHWLGIEWEEPVRRQSEHMEDYQRALNVLKEKGLIYPCFCTRKNIHEEIIRAGSAPHGPEGALYPGICRNLKHDEQEARKKKGTSYALRLNMKKALATLNEPLFWTDVIKGKQKATPELLGDPVLARKDVMASYHLCVTLDDHLQGITCVTRGEDLFYASHLHRLLQHLLGLDVPIWHHHPLLLDCEGKRFAKRNHSVTLKFLREKKGKTPADIMSMVGLRLP
ncbi:MAG: tRNA glutamyl-Q(34) synthetase GluQRS [Alphaproteobacteria bacterium]|nr:tRNA glutamyl-Q(34) synthetase GluQRS [Alphaproteobacteria bacterium]